MIYIVLSTLIFTGNMI